MGTTKSLGVNLDISPADRAVLKQMQDLDSGKKISFGVSLNLPQAASIDKFTKLVDLLESKKGIDFKINIDMEAALQGLSKLKKELNEIGNNINIRVSYGSAGGRSGGSSGSSGGGSNIGPIGSLKSSADLSIKDQISELKTIGDLQLKAAKDVANYKQKLANEEIALLETSARTEVAVLKAKQGIAAKDRANNERAQANARTFGGTFEDTLSKTLAKQEVQKRRVNRSLHELRNTYDERDLGALIFGNNAARVQERLKKADVIADKRNLNPTAHAAFLEAARNEKLPAGFDLGRLKNKEALQGLGFSAIYGGLPSVLLGGALGATPLGGAGVALGSNIAQAAGALLEKPREIFDSIKEKIQETALTFERSVVGISASLLQATDTFDAFGQKVTNVPVLLNSTERSARELQTAAKPALAALGVSGAAEGSAVQSLETGFLGRGIFANGAQFKTVASRIIGAAVAKNANFFENETLAARDILDVSTGAPTAQRTQLGILLGKENVAKIGRSSSIEELLKNTEGLEPFVNAATQSDNPATLRRKLDAQVGNLEQTAGSEFLSAQKEALGQVVKELGNPDTIQAAKELGRDIGLLSAEFLKLSATGIKVGAGVVSFVDSTKGLLGVLVTLGTAIGAVNVALNLSAAIETARAAAIAKGAAGEAAWAAGSTFGSSVIGGGKTVGGIGNVLGGIGQAGAAIIGSPLFAAAAVGAGLGLVTNDLVNLVSNRELKKAQDKDDKRSDLVGELQTLGGTKATSSVQIKSVLTRLGLAESAGSFETERAGSSIAKLAGISHLFKEFGGTDELRGQSAFLEGQRIDAEKGRFALESKGLDRNTFGGKLSAGDVERRSLETQLSFAENRVSADSAALAKARSEKIPANEARIKELENSLSSGEIFQEQTHAHSLSTKNPSTANTSFLDELKDTVTSSFFPTLSNDFKDAVSSNDRDAYVKIANKKAELAQKELVELRRSQRLGLGADPAAAEQAALQTSQLEANALRQELKDNERGKLGLEQQRTEALGAGIDSSTITGRKAKLALNEDAVDRYLGSIVVENDEDRAKQGSIIGQKISNQFEKRLLGAGIPQQELALRAIDSGTIGGRINAASASATLHGSRISALDAQIAADRDSLTTASGQKALQYQQDLERRQAERADEVKGLAGDKRSVGEGQLSQVQTFQNLRNGAESLAEAERRQKSELDNLTISMQEGRNALIVFKAGLDEARTGQEERLLGSAKEFVGAGGDITKLPGYLRDAVQNPEEYQKRFAGAKFAGVLRELTGVDDQTLLAGPSLGIPSFGSRASENLDFQGRKLANNIDLSATSRDLFFQQARNQRESFHNSLQEAALHAGQNPEPGAFATAGGLFGGSPVSVFLANLQKTIDASRKEIDKAKAAEVGGGLPIGGPGNQGTAAGKAHDKQNEDSASSGDKKGPIASIDSGDMDKLANKIAAAIAITLLGGTAAVGSA